MRKLNRIILLLVVPLLLSAGAHKFYVSITNIEYVPEKQSLQIISKLFIDDIEDVLQERYDKGIRLASRKEKTRDAEYLQEYILQKFDISVNGKPVKIKYIGREYDVDMVKVYMEVTGVKSLNTLEVESKWLMDLFPEQQNIIHVKTPDNRKSLVLERDNPKGLLNL